MTPDLAAIVKPQRTWYKIGSAWSEPTVRELARHVPGLEVYVLPTGLWFRVTNDVARLFLALATSTLIESRP